VIDEKALARDIISETITVVNLTSHVVDVYPIVNNIDVVDGKQEFLNRADVLLEESLANWIEISRGVLELQPGEVREVPVQIIVHMNAKPGKYHALISFMWGSSRAQAENNVKFGVASAVNIEVVEDVRERLQLGSFMSRELFFASPDVSFSYDLENIGNKDLTPTGEVRIFDRRGHELGSVPVNTEGIAIAPNEMGQIASSWTATKGFGKYKALLDIEYGRSQVGTVNDTIYFWVIPWKSILVLFFVLATLVAGLTYFLWGMHEQKHQPAYVMQKAKRRYARRTDSVFVEDSPIVSAHSTPSGAHVMDMRE
jgi:hypothetical protein